MAYTENGIGVKGATVGQNKELAELLLSRINTLSVSDGNSVKAVTFSNSTLNFFRTTDTTGTPAFTISLPTEYFLDLTRTMLVPSFAWNSTTFPGSTNPNLDGKPVMVLAVKGEDGSGNPIVSYSFLDLALLSDTGKADKVSGAVSGNFASLDNTGNLVDSGDNKGSFVLSTELKTKSSWAVDGTDTTETYNHATLGTRNYAASHTEVVNLANAVAGKFATDNEFDQMLLAIGLISA